MPGIAPPRPVTNLTVSRPNAPRHYPVPRAPLIQNPTALFLDAQAKRANTIADRNSAIRAYLTGRPTVPPF